MARSLPSSPPPGTSRDPAGTVRLRGLIATVCVGLIVSLALPWSSETVRTRGLTGPRRIETTFSGWQSLALSGLVCLVVSLVLLVLLAVRGRTTVAGLGAAARRTARTRVDGGMVAAGGLVCVVALLAGFVASSAPAMNVAGAHAGTGIGWGAAVALVLALGLVAGGLGLVRSAAVAAGRERAEARSPVPPARDDIRVGRVRRPERVGRTGDPDAL